MAENEPAVFINDGFNINPQWWALVIQDMWDSGRVLFVILLLTSIFLFVNESTLPPLAGIVAMIWLLNLGNPGNLRKQLTFAAIFLAFSGLFWQLLDTARGMWVIFIIAYAFIWFLIRRNPEFMKRLEFWGFTFAVLGSTWVWFTFGQERSIIVILLWLIMTLSGFGIFFSQMAGIYSRGRSGQDLTKKPNDDRENSNADQTNNSSKNDNLN